MKAPEFNELVNALWQDDWRLKIDDLLRKHGYRYSRQTFYEWQKGNRDVPEPVALILWRVRRRKTEVPADSI